MGALYRQLSSLIARFWYRLQLSRAFLLINEIEEETVRILAFVSLARQWSSAQE